MAQMAGSGLNYINGTFTIPNDSTTLYKLNFGKTFSKYMFLIEMDDNSKTNLMNSGETSNRGYAVQGIYPMPKINDTEPSRMNVFERVNPSTQAVTATYGSGPVSTSSPPDQTSITFATGAISAGQGYLYRGYTYKYFVFELK